ncbi:MAG: M23 family metallopeptidase [Nitrospira sp.]|nr:M23 family metallopeptidase [Nitrospira sp.]MBH0181344.1 M23 family metallopeptidase [Nitrospira sp.]MBH0185053.1 M23 family metallopeptidase [Nitrospira sp.]
MVFIAMFLWAGLVPVGLCAGISLGSQSPEGHYSGKQGQIIVITVPTDEASAHVQGKFLGRAVSFFQETRPGEPKGFVGLLGIDMQEEPGTHELAIQVTDGEHGRSLSYRVLVLKEKFRVEHLKLPKDKVDLDEQGLARWKGEQEQVKAALAADSPMKLWQPSFVEPVSGKRTGIFGSVRIMNGQARNPHNGEDIGAPLGTDVAATNDGTVRLTVDHIFSGKGVFLDHGLGFYSMYFHLSDVLVKEGDLVRAGQIVGKVGATGRATGPHLHWGVKLNGARVNPYALLDLPFKAEPQSATSTSAAESGSTAGVPAP